MPVPLLRQIALTARDASHVALARTGDRAAAERLVETHVERISAVVSALLGPGSPDVGDAVQETFVRALGRLHQCRSDATFPAWLARIARNVCRDMRKSAWAARVVLGPGSDTAREARDDTGRLDLARALAELPERERIVVILHFVDGYGLTEIGALLGQGAEAVRSRLRRALARLRATLGPEWEEDLP